jgi:hypothetical protein
LLEGYLIQPESGLKASTSVRSAAQRPRCSQIKRPFQILDSPPLPPFPLLRERQLIAKARTTLVGKVEKLIHPHPSSGEPEKAQIAVEGADHLYREIRVQNSLTDENGRKVKLEKGAEVDLKIEADSRVTKAAPSHEDGGYPPRP